VSVVAGGLSILRAARADIVVSVLVVVAYWDEVWNATFCRHLRQTVVGLWSLLRGRQRQTLPSHHQASSQRSVDRCPSWRSMAKVILTHQLGSPEAQKRRPACWSSLNW